MLPFGESFLAIVAALVVPTLIGLSIIVAVGKQTSAKYLAAFGLGIYLWFFSDTIGGASYLDVNSGFSGGPLHVVIYALFAVGLLVVFSLDRGAFRQGIDSNVSFAIPLIVAFAVGMHGWGEGADFGASAAQTTSTDLLSAFGGLTAAVAYVLHKGLEPMMVGIAYWIYAKDRAKSLGGIGRDIAMLTLVFVLPGIIGAATGYYLQYEDTYFFAIGTGTSIYAAVRLAKPLFVDYVSGLDSLKMALVIFFGFSSIYFAALFHS